MRAKTVVPVTVRAVNARELERRIEKLKERIRQRAYELYCRRSRKCEAIDDWAQAEAECCAAPLAGLAEEGNNIRITACVPGAAASDLAVDVLPDEIVIEADRNGEIERYKRFPLPAPVDANAVKACLRGSELDVIAPRK